jgi:hypothetical protein
MEEHSTFNIERRTTKGEAKLGVRRWKLGVGVNTPD